MTPLMIRLVLLLALPFMLIGCMALGLIYGLVMGVMCCLFECMPVWWRLYRDGVLR